MDYVWLTDKAIEAAKKSLPVILKNDGNKHF